MKELVRLTHVSKTFHLPRGPVEALRDITLRIPEGQIFGVMGKNGSGKSTLLKLMAGIFAPSAGDVWRGVADAPLLGLKGGFDWRLTGETNLRLLAAVLGIPRATLRKYYDEIVVFAGVENFMRTPLTFFSTGMQARLAFSLMRYVTAPLLLFDEVLAVGDTEFRQRCFRELKRLQGQGKTIVWAGHRIEDLPELCEQAVYLEAGRIETAGSARTIVNHYRAYETRG